MSNSDNDEYEVEYILRARMEEVGKRGVKAWSYLVKWKNYNHDENTWEPPSSFDGGSEHFIDSFWARIDTGGRDVTNVEGFHVGEEMFPAGPPRKKVKKRRTPSPESSLQYPDYEEEDEIVKALGPNVNSPSTRNKRPSYVDEYTAPSSKRKHAPEASSKFLEETVSVKRRRGPPGIPAYQMQADEPLKRKKGPPGIPAHQLGQSTSSKRKRSPEAIDDELEEEGISTSTKRKRAPPGIPAHKIDEPAPLKRRRGPPGIPAFQLQTYPSPAAPVEEEISRLELESVITDDEPPPSPPKRKRGRPPGRRPSELEAEERAAVEAAAMAAAKAASPRKTPHGKRFASDLHVERVVPDSQSESTPKATTTAQSTRPLSLPRRRGRPKTTAPKPPSVVVLTSDGDEAPPKKAVPVQETLDVDELANSPSVFGRPSLLDLQPAHVPEVPPDGETTASSSLPAHRLRAANPRVKITDDPNLTEMNGPEAIAVKARFMKRSANDADKPSSRVSGSRAGPGRSSSGLFPESTRLTVQKGVLTSMKRKSVPKATAEDAPASDMVDAERQDDPKPETAPTGQELLEAAGIDKEAAKDLPDFEDGAGDGEPPNAPELQDPATAPESPRVFESLKTTQTQGSPTLQAAKPLTFTHRVSKWGQSTIFGPLALGFATRGQSDLGLDASADTKKYSCYLNVDPAVSVPIALKDLQASQFFLDGLDSAARNPTGKFYKGEHAIALIDTLKTKRSYARVVLAGTANDEQGKHFKRFVSRLQANELFIQMNRAETLVMCASDNTVLCQKLAIPTQLIGLGDTVIVTHVDIENHSQYAEAAVHADTSRW